METLRAAYEMAKRNDGAPGIDGVTFEAIEAQGVEADLPPKKWTRLSCF
jgi:RNA-directed DNA polymerase